MDDIENKILDFMKCFGEIQGSEFALRCYLYYSPKEVYSTLENLFNQGKFTKEHIKTTYKLPDKTALEYDWYKPNYDSRWEKISYLFRTPNIDT